MANSDYDFQTLVTAYGDALDVLDEIIAIFLEETPQRIEKLKGALEGRNFEALHRVSHGLANTTGTLRADNALKLAREIEAHARKQETDGVPALIDSLESEVNEVLRQIEEYRNKR